MGGQLSSPASSSSISSSSSSSSSSSASSPSSNSSPSPDLSSLGSHGQQSARCRSSSPPTQSASQSSLALSSLSANSIGRHSSALIRPLGAVHSPPDPPSASFGQSRFLISPPMFRRNNQGKEPQIGGAKALSRWGSFTKALPSLVRGNSAGNHHAAKNGGKELKMKRQQQIQIHHHLANGMVGQRKVGVGMVDPNNNKNDYVHHHLHLHNANAPPNIPPSFYEQQTTTSPWNGNGREHQGDGEADGQCHSQGRQQDFSLKQSLKKSGSRLFNGILKGGYIRALLGDEDAEKGEADESEDEDEMSGGSSSIGESGHRDDLLNNNNGGGGGGTHFDQFPAKSSAASSAAPRLRPSSTSFFHGGHLHQQPSTKSIGTSALRSSLRQAKRHFLLPGHHQSNGNGPVGGNGLVSSMLLAMAAGQPIPPAHHQSIARPFSCPTNEAGQQMLDWNGNGNNARNSTANGQRKKIIQASSSELIRALGHFVSQHCRPGLLGQFEPSQLSTWLRGVDRALILQGWQDAAFINPANLVFLFMLIRDAFVQGDCQRLNSLRELHSFVLLCLYISYSYMGNEISYPLKPFITENTNRTLFWSQCVRLIKQHSGQMLRLNSSSTFFLEVFTELRAYCPDYLTQSKASYY